ncbi:MAG: DUF6036 family nucleotidyltransferase [Candidatus Binatia bacterium]|nr:DUF6036 family nucleotidyltransferase [Candidatus Binatia bacterium]
MLAVKDLHDAFTELGALARGEGKVIDLAIYGGSALMLASNFRVATQDVDAVVEGDQSTVTRLAEEVARRRGWAADWLNDGVRTYLSPNVEGLAEHHELFCAYPSEQDVGLRVFVPSPEYMLAMKLMAMRLDPAGGKSDLADIVNLMEVVGLNTPDETIDFAASFYPEAKISARLHLGIRELWRMRENLGQEGQHGAPRYLGRGRTAS